MQISSEDIETLENIVQKYTSGSISKPNAIASLAIEIGKIATRLEIVPSESLIQPYVDKIEAFDRENREAEERGNRGSSNQRHEDEREQGGEHDRETRARTEQETDTRREAPHEAEREEIRGSRRARSEADEHEDAEAGGSRKRIKADVGKYKWNDADSFLESIFTLTPAHQTVREQVRNYAADIKESLRDLETAFGKPFLPNSQWKNILLNRYCDLDEIAANIYTTEHVEPEIFTVGESQLALRRPQPTKKVGDESTWNHAFRVYRDAVNFAFKGRAKELEAYERHIVSLFKARHYEFRSQVIIYDRAVRIHVGGRHDILLNEFHKFADFKDATLNAGGVLFGAGSASGSSQPATHSDKGKHRSINEICRNWNFKQCARSPCRFRHVCIDCGKPGHTATKCPRRGKTAA
ncbi:MAG: hypothetical protein NXY57DRAFT_907304 [Lentinula lateritia]|nr:MAG: hypothetical protein NXY57DRAFT_907304 [Lentinula lateritia]